MSAAVVPDPRVSDPVVSVVITTYNDEKYIARALASVLEQATPVPFEVICRGGLLDRRDTRCSAASDRPSRRGGC